MSSIFACRWTVEKRFVFETTRRFSPSRRSRSPASIVSSATGVGEARALVVAQDAETRLRDDRDRLALDHVLAVAEEDEVAVEEPLEEEDASPRSRPACSALRRPGPPRSCAGTRALIASKSRTVAWTSVEDPSDPVHELGQLLRRQMAADLEVHDRLARPSRRGRAERGGFAPARRARCRSRGGSPAGSRGPGRSSSSETESTRNGESSQFVSTTDPTVV